MLHASNSCTEVEECFTVVKLKLLNVEHTTDCLGPMICEENEALIFFLGGIFIMFFFNAYFLLKDIFLSSDSVAICLRHLGNSTCIYIIQIMTKIKR